MYVWVSCFLLSWIGVKEGHFEGGAGAGAGADADAGCDVEKANVVRL